MAKLGVVEGVVKINVPIDYEELQRQIQENEDMTKKLISQKTIDEVERIEYLEQFKPLVEITEEDLLLELQKVQSQQQAIRRAEHATKSDFDVLLYRIDLIDKKLDRLLERMSDADTTDSL